MAQQDTWTKKDLTGIEELSRSEIELLFRQADRFLPALAPGKGLDLMKGRTVVNLFLEPSTRTRTAFEISAKKLGAEVVSINTTASSLVKGETLRDTALNIRAMGVDAIVMRHSSAGAARKDLRPRGDRLSDPLLGALRRAVINEWANIGRLVGWVTYLQLRGARSEARLKRFSD